MNNNLQFSANQKRPNSSRVWMNPPEVVWSQALRIQAGT